MNIAEQLAGVPWTPARAKQHVVDETSLSLNKVLIFNNNLSNPFQTWQQGSWFASWEEGPEGEHTCTLYASVSVTEQKVKPRKGQHFKWQPVPGVIKEQLAAHTAATITQVTNHNQWHTLAGKDSSKTKAQETPYAVTSNAEETIPAVATSPPQYAG